VLPAGEIVDEPGHAWLSDAAVHPGGRVFAAGTVATFDAVRGIFAGDMMLVAFDDGGIDTSFALGAGYFVISPAIRVRWHEAALGVAVRPDESLIVVGRSYRHSNDGDVHQMRLYRVQPAGLPVANGTLGNVFGPDEWATAVAIGPESEAYVSARALQP